MKTLYIRSLIFGMLSFALMGQDCVDCLNNVDGMLPADMSGITKLTAGISCAAAVETVVSDDFFATEEPKQDICECIINKNIDGIKEESPKQELRLKKAYARMMESRFVANGKRLADLAHSITLSGRDATSLANGGVCDIEKQFQGVSCYGTPKFKSAVDDLFEIDKKYDAKCGEYKSSEKVGCYWRAESAKSSIGVLPNQPITSSLCLDRSTSSLIEKMGGRLPGDLKFISHFVNRENGNLNKHFDFKELDRLSRELGSPHRAIKKLEKTNPDYTKLRRIIERYPEIAGMFDGHSSFALLKGIFSGAETELENSDRFLSKHFTGEGNKNLVAIYKNIEKSCLDYQEDLDNFLCKEIGDPYINDQLFIDAFEKDSKLEGEIDSLDEALVCHAKYCKEGKVIDRLRGYCLPVKAGLSLKDDFNKAFYDFHSKEFVVVDKLIDDLGLGNDPSALIQNDLCRYLVCDDQSQKKCKRDSKNQLNRAEDLLAENCPNGYEKDGDSMCLKEIYDQLNDFAAIQAREVDSGMVVIVEVPDMSQPADSDGNYPMKREYQFQDGFAEHFWAVDGDVPYIAPPVKVIHKSLGKKKKGKAKTPVDRSIASSANSVLPKAVAPIERKNNIPVNEQSIQAQNLARAAIDMAKKATDLSDRVARKIQKRVEGNPQKVTTSNNGDNTRTIESDDKSVQEHGNVSDNLPSHSKIADATIRGFSPARRLPGSVTDTVGSVSTKESHSISRAALPRSFGLPEGIDSGVLGGAIPPSNQTINLKNEDLPRFETKLLKEQGVDPHKPFMMEIIVDGKVYKVEVKPFVYKGKLLYRPELDHLKKEKPELYQAIRMSPFFQDYLAFEKGQKVYRWGDVLELLSQTKTAEDNA